ncbi:DnaB-like helicase N-terminal domain-containing protein [Streptomyces sp. H39-C1]|uniref:DnaB-like helicase N-terminal domain-containing protein n=1 Tax=Streptomyces sp. H39-C1 TaxID=3004355 RepID=UPI0022B01797|nr:DnaB-like helicase N-terminal domain-containing protein [Streptomyces sp. H39-C1]MCZ4103743.1 replicative DNA helicase [Streptomyces sp. H39-C1]
MHHTPEPGHDDLDAATPPPPVFHAEQALLGALLLEPHRLGEVTSVGSEAFSTAAHAAVFRAISSLPAADPVDHTQSTQWLDAVLSAAREQAPGLTATYLHHLIQVCPRPRHAPAYARMIEAEHARRRLAAAAQHLGHTARDTSLPQPVITTLDEADALATVVDDIAARFPSHAGSLPRTHVPEPTPPPDQEALDEEQLLLATATALPTIIEQMRWLTPGDFTQPLHAGLWQCLNALTRRDTPVDPVTLLWEAQHRRLLAAGADPRELLDLLNGPLGSPDHWGERVLQRSLLATAQHTSQIIEAFTNDPATTPNQLVVGSRRALAGLSAVRTRWQHATAPAPARHSRPSKPCGAPQASRAGPPRTTAPPPARISR